MHANCPKDRLGNRMGTHDVERYIRGNVVHSAWEEGGFWGVDFSDLHYPKAVAWFVPPVRSDSNRRTGHADDVLVMEDGVNHLPPLLAVCHAGGRGIESRPLRQLLQAVPYGPCRAAPPRLARRPPLYGRTSHCFVGRDPCRSVINP